MVVSFRHPAGGARAGVKSAITKLKARAGSALIPIDYDKYNQETSELVVKISELTRKSDKLRGLIGREREALTSLLHQRSILESTIKELKADEKSLAKLPDLVECPTCGHEHENAFSERFKIARDQDSCQELLEEIIRHIERQEETVRSHDLEHGELRKESEILRQQMDVKRSEFSMREIVQNAGEQRAMELLQEEVDHHQAVIEKKDHEVAALTIKMDQLTRKERSKEVISHLKGLISDFTLEIGARNPQKFKGPLVNLSSDGSELPRQILAATIAYVATAEKFGDPRRLPMVIDSPLQQEQDDDSIIGILKFMSKKRIDSQVILGTVSTKGIPFTGSVIELTNDKHRLLNDGEYEQNKHEIDDYITAFTAEDASSITT